MPTKQEKNRQMGSLKLEYKGTPAPREAKERMLVGIVQAREERKGVIIMRSAKKTGRVAAVVMIVVTILANATPALANTMEQTPIAGSIAKVVTSHTCEDKRNHFETDIRIPQVAIEGTRDAQVPASKSVEDRDNEPTAMYKEELSRDNGKGHCDLDSRYEVVTDNSRYLCTRIDTTLIMASGTQFVRVFTIDKVIGNIISLKGLFHDCPEMLDTISANTKSQMAGQVAKDESIMCFYQSDMPDEDFEGPTGDENYYSNENGEFVITFNEYGVTPGYMGTVQFTIPGPVIGASQIPSPVMHTFRPHIPY